MKFSHEKEGNPAICNNVDWTWGHYAKWNKLDRGKQITYSTLVFRIWKSKTHRIRVEQWLPGAGEGGGREWGDAGQRAQTSSYKMNKF